jgi:hypothetical protein
MPLSITGRWLSAALMTASFPVLLIPHAEARSWSFTGPRDGIWNRSVTHYNNGSGNFGRTVTTINGERIPQPIAPAPVAYVPPPGIYVAPPLLPYL